MVTYANVQVAPVSSGVPYSVNRLVPGAEGDLYNQGVYGADPVPILYTQAVAVAVRLTALGSITSNTTYVVLQTDLGTPVWFDVAWFLWAGTSGAVDFWLCGGVDGANAVQQSRAVGTPPASTGSRQIVLGDRCRVVGKATLNGGQGPSSSPSGSSFGVFADVRYKALGLR